MPTVQPVKPPVISVLKKLRAIPHNSKCRYGERGAADAKPKAQIILDATKVSAASGGNSEPKQGQRSQSARGFCPRSTMRVPQPDIIEHFGNADAAPRSPYRHLELCGIALNLFLPVLSLRNEPTRISCELPHSPAHRFCIFHRSSPSPSTLKPPSVTVKPTSCPTSSAVQREPT